jgi:NADPH:quinone reductase-like Zn-dependent oxidoreductase
MKALLSKEPGGPDTLALEDVAEPEAGKGQVVVAVRACSINYPDVLIIEDRYQFKPQRPFAPGGEIAGVIESVGEGVDGWAPGDRVVAVIGHGGLAEKVAIDASRLFHLPEGRSFEDGAALILTYGTTIHALLDRGHLKQGHTLLVLGAAGGVGLAAIELGKAFGARVVAAVSTEEKAEAARAAGADVTTVYPRAPFDKEASKALADQFKAAVGPQGADVVYDPVGGAVFDASLRCVAWGARLVVVGFAAGQVPQIPANILLVKNIDALGFFFGSYRQHRPDLLRAGFGDLAGLYQAGKLKPHVSQVLPLEGFQKAFELLIQRRSTGKVVLTMT